MIKHVSIQDIMPRINVIVLILIMLYAVSGNPLFAADVSISIVADNPPVQVPAGEYFTATVHVTNLLAEAQTVDVWIDVGIPGGALFGPVQQWDDVALAASEEIDLPVWQDIPASVPRIALPFQYIAKAGEFNTVVDAQDAFDFRMLPERSAVEFSLASTSHKKVVAPGERIEWKIKALVSTLENQGLAMFSVDLVQDPGNPDFFDMPAGNRAPNPMKGFDRPKGITNPIEEDPWGSGYGGISDGPYGAKNVIQIGGMQNTFGIKGPCLGPSYDICTGRDNVVDADIGQNAAGRIIATGEFNAPDTPGLYFFNLENAMANTLEQVNNPPAVSTVKMAPVVIFKPHIADTVSTDPKSGGMTVHSAEPGPERQSARSRECLFLPAEDAVMNRTHIQFRWEPFERSANPYSIWIVEDDLNGDPFNSGLPVMTHQGGSAEPRTVIKSGLAYGKDYAWCVTDGVEPDSPVGQVGPIHRFSIMEIPAWMPEIVVTEPNGPGYAQPGLTMFRGPRRPMEESYHQVLLLENSGAIALLLSTGRQILSDLRLVETGDGRHGHILGGKNEAFEFTLDGKVLWTSPLDVKIHHEAYPKFDGNLLSLHQEERTVMINDEQVQRIGDVVVEFNRHSKETVWSWNTFDYYPIEIGDVGPIGNEEDWTHSNSVVHDPVLNRIYISVRHLSRVTCIDYENGDIIFNMGKDWGDTDFGHNLFTAQHAIQLLPGGRMMLYDNGNWNEPLNDPRQSRAIELAFDPSLESAADASIVWEWGLEDEYGDPIFCDGQGDADRLPNGNTLVTGFNLFTIWEVNPAAEVIWQVKLNFPGEEEYKIYRAERILEMNLDTPGDFDNDWDIDIHDLAAAQAGFTGDGPAALAFPYTLTDYDKDDDIDLDDLYQLSFWMTGPGLTKL